MVNKEVAHRGNFKVLAIGPVIRGKGFDFSVISIFFWMLSTAQAGVSVSDIEARENC